LNISTNDFAKSIDCQNVRERFLERAAQFKEVAGRELVIEKNEKGDFVLLLSQESTQRGSFLLEFWRAGSIPGPLCPDDGAMTQDSFMFRLENYARRYAELRDELLERYADDEDELFKQLGKLNHAFEGALFGLFSIGIPKGIGPTQIFVNDMPQSMHNVFRHEVQEWENTKSLMHTIQQSMTRHMNTFFETFIKSIQSDNIETAFSNSINALESSETRSLSNMSFRDTLQIWDTLNRGRIQRTEDKSGNWHDTFIRNSPNHSLRVISGNRNITDSVRREIADLMGFRWRG